MTDLVIFDCDGTLVDSERIWVDTEYEMIAELGYHIRRDDLQRIAMGRHFKDWRGAIELHIGGSLPDDFGRDCMARVEAFVAKAAEIPPMPGACDVLERIGIPYGMASNAPTDYLADLLSKTGLCEFFPQEHVFSVYRRCPPKPAPDIFLYAAAQMGYAPDACLVIEDSVAGVQGAVAAGMEVWGVTCAYPNDRAAHTQRLREAGAAQVLDDLRLIPDMLGQRPNGHQLL